MSVDSLSGLFFLPSPWVNGCFAEQKNGLWEWLITAPKGLGMGAADAATSSRALQDKEKAPL